MDISSLKSISELLVSTHPPQNPPNDESPEIVTASEIETFLTCRRKWWLQYVAQLESIKYVNMSFHRGTIYHAGLAVAHLGLDAVQDATRSVTNALSDTVTLNEQIELDQYREIANLQIERYCKVFSESPFLLPDHTHIETEVVCETECCDMNFRLAGTYDKLVDNFVIDYKVISTLNDNALDSYSTRFQFFFYGYILHKQNFPAFDFQVHLLRYPALRQTKSENRQGFVQRIKDAMIEKPEEYFRIHTVYRSEEINWKQWENEILFPILKDLQTCKTNLRLNYANTQSCTAYFSRCPMFSLCWLPDTNVLENELMEYKRKQYKHQEHYYTK